jgi:hypothetical protein
MMSMTTPNRVPTELNWVRERAACTVATVFNALRNEIGEDVEAVNQALSIPETSRFQVDVHSDGSTIFIGRPNMLSRVRVIIGVSDGRIIVNEEWNGTKWSASIGLNDEGRCTLRLCDEKGESTAIEMEHWQFRKRALESLFFGVRQ